MMQRAETLREQGAAPKKFATKPKDKYRTRAYNRCGVCGRPRAFMRDFGICRCCFRQLAEKAQIPGVRKSSW